MTLLLQHLEHQFNNDIWLSFDTMLIFTLVLIFMAFVAMLYRWDNPTVGKKQTFRHVILMTLALTIILASISALNMDVRSDLAFCGKV